MIESAGIRGIRITLDKKSRLSKISTRSLYAAILMSVMVLNGQSVFAAEATPVSSLPDAAARGEGHVLPVRAIEARLSQGYEIRERYVGRVLSRRASLLGFEHSGLLTGMQVDEGDRVRKGEILATLDTTRYQARRQELVADLTHNQALRRETENRLALAQVTTKRRKTLFDSKAVSRQLYDEALFNVKLLQSTLQVHDAAIERVKAAIAVVDVDINLSKLFAPFDGMIVERLVDEGVALSSGSPVVRLIEDSIMDARIGIPEQIISRLDPSADYTIDVNGESYVGRIRAILNILDPETRTIPVIFNISANPDAGTLRSGQLARIDIDHTIKDTGFWLPLGSLIGGRRGLWNAMALELEAEEQKLFRVSRREVQVLHTDSGRVYVRGAMQTGDLVVSDGLHRVVPGQVVRLVDSVTRY